MPAIYFDMDGTIADLYNVNNWLPMLIAEDSTPYRIAQPLGNLNNLITLCNQLKEQGYSIGVISWTAKHGSPQYNKRVRAAKVRWLNKYFNVVDEIHVVKYGTPKHNVTKANKAILFDDELNNCNAWNECENYTSYHVSCIKDIENYCIELLCA